MKIKQMLEKVKGELAGAGITDSAEAEWLVALTLNIKRSEVYSLGESELTNQQQEALEEALKKRKQHIPLAYIIGDAEFYGLKFTVSENVLIPRPETEEVVSEALKYINSNSKVLDIGTGSGAIAVTVAKKKGAKVAAVDISEKALEIARENAKNNQVNVEFMQSDVFSSLKHKKFDVIISNPPYISESEYETLMPEVKNFEPKIALVAEDEGMSIYKQIINEAPEHLEKNGVIVFEIGYNQGKEIQKLLEKDFKEIKILKDLQGNDRIALARLK